VRAPAGATERVPAADALPSLEMRRRAARCAPPAAAPRFGPSAIVHSPPSRAHLPAPLPLAAAYELCQYEEYKRRVAAAAAPKE
jgi:hypothetical protein